MMSWNVMGVTNAILIVELAKLLLFMHGILGMELSEQRKNYLKFAGIYVSLVLAGCGWNLSFIVIEIVILISFVYFIFKEKLLQKFFNGLFCILAINLFDSLIQSVFVKGYSYEFKNFIDIGIVRLFGNSVSLIILALVRFYMRKKKSNHLHITINKHYLIITLITFGLISTLLGSIEAIYIGYNYKELSISFIICCIGLILFVFVIFLLLLMVIQSKKQLQKIANLNEKIILEQKEYYEITFKKDTDLRKFRHDYNTHMYVLKQLAKEKDYAKLINYIDELVEFSESVNCISVGNSIADAVISDIYFRTKKKNIKFSCLGKLPERITIKDTDICILFSNVLKNALEAVERLKDSEEHYITLEITNYGNNIYIYVRNSCNTVNLKDKYKTSKNDILNHGYGIDLMKNIVERYNGKIEFEVYDNEFETRITF